VLLRSTAHIDCYVRLVVDGEGSCRSRSANLWAKCVHSLSLPSALGAWHGSSTANFAFATSQHHHGIATTSWHCNNIMKTSKLIPCDDHPLVLERCSAASRYSFSHTLPRYLTIAHAPTSCADTARSDRHISHYSNHAKSRAVKQVGIGGIFFRCGLVYFGLPTLNCLTRIP
jgi:hypothetical protein